jgi:hypothetical protein
MERLLGLFRLGAPSNHCDLQRDCVSSELGSPEVSVMHRHPKLAGKFGISGSFSMFFSPL